VFLFPPGQPVEEDLELVERVRQGDLEAFNVIVVAYQDRIYSLCLRMLGSPQSAEDAAQEAFISAYKSVSKLRGANVRSWLFRIASNRCIDELRRRQRRPLVSLDAPTADEEARPLDVPDKELGPEGRALQGELHAALQSELLLLPDDQRLAVTLCDMEGLQYEEIAEVMGSSVGTVKSRISRGRARLRIRIREQPELFGLLLRPIGEGE
jgi:RNA polymerase sigma-70 factor (ECF subfamily)